MTVTTPMSDKPLSIAAQRINEDIKNKKYNPMNDVLFKFIFGKEERKKVTIHFLNSVLEREGEDAIKDITFQNSELVPLNDEDKLTRLDIYCITEKGEQIDVEVQIVNRKNMEQRSLFYWSQMYISTLYSGGKYQDLKPAITINILSYNLFPEDEDFHSMFSIYNMKTGRRLNKDMELHFLEVPKFKKKPIKEMTSIERWLAYFSNKLDEKEMEELAMNEAAIQTALDATATFMQDDKERWNYLNREMAIWDYNSDKVAWTEEGRKEGCKEGEEKERKEGIVKMVRTLKNLSIEQPKVIEQLIREYSLTQSEAQAAVQANW